MLLKNFKTSTSLFTLLKRQTFVVVLIIGLGLLIFNMVYAVIDTRNTIAFETQRYKSSLRAELIAEVSNAIAVVDTIINEESLLTLEEKKALSESTLNNMQLPNKSYYFGADYDGNTILGPAKGRNVFDIEDKNGLKVVQALIAAAKKGGGFVEYTMPPIEGVEQKPKISYVLPVEEFEWYIGAGVDYDVINNVIVRIRDDERKALLLRSLLTIIVMVFSIGTAYALNRKAYSRILNHVEVLVHYIQKGATSQIQIPVESFKVDEFRIIAKRTQEMIDQREAQELLLEKQAFCDSITELPNRNAFDAKITELLTKYRDGEPIQGAIILMDIDHFKVTNDTFGHIFGNKVLCAIAARLIEEHTVFVARIGGDEFVAVIDQFESMADLDGYVNAVRMSFDRPIVVDGRQLHFSTSIGVTIFPKDGEHFDDLIRKADLAMYRSKETGRSRYTYFDDSLLEGNYNFFFYDNKIKNALEANEFYLDFQPQYDSKTLEIVGLEGLVRWRTNDGVTIMPNAFIPIAEKTGTISQITQIVIKKACQFSSRINVDRQKAIPISINISTQDLTDPEMVTQLDYWTSAYGISTGGIVLEITETGLFDNFEAAIRQMEELKEKGYHFSLDDFGTGYSSLSYVMKLPIDVIKIDKSFVDRLPDSDKSAKMIMVIEDIARTLSLYTVAEGVETAEQADILGRLGIHALQGYHFSRPLPEDEIIKRLT